jgi:hypothetical protein
MQAVPRQHDGFTLILTHAMRALLIDLEATASTPPTPSP